MEKINSRKHRIISTEESLKDVILWIVVDEEDKEENLSDE